MGRLKWKMALYQDLSWNDFKRCINLYTPPYLLCVRNYVEQQAQSHEQDRWGPYPSGACILVAGFTSPPTGDVSNNWKMPSPTSLLSRREHPPGSRPKCQERIIIKCSHFNSHHSAARQGNMVERASPGFRCRPCHLLQLILPEPQCPQIKPWDDSIQSIWHINLGHMA